MSDVTIKFWNDDENCYEEPNFDYVTGDGRFQCWKWCDIYEKWIYAKNITAHFYIGEKRIA